MSKTPINMLEHIHNSNLIEGIDDEQADADSLACWERMQAYDHIGHYELLLMHRMITQHQTDLSASERGQYRNIQVYVGNHTPPAPALIRSLMDNFLQTMIDKDPKDAHIEFETIHPFVDGNGRTGRMLMWWHEQKLGRYPLLIPIEYRQNYYRWFTNHKRPRFE